MAKDCSQFEGVENCFGWSVCVEIEKTNQPDFPEGFPFSDNELIVWIELESETIRKEEFTHNDSLYSNRSTILTIKDAGCRAIRDQYGNISEGFIIEIEERHTQYRPASEEVDEIDNEWVTRKLINVEYGDRYEPADPSEGSHYDWKGKYLVEYRPETSLFSKILNYGANVLHSSDNNYKGLLGTRAAINYITEGNPIKVRGSGFSYSGGRFYLNESEEEVSTRTVFLTPNVYTVKTTNKRTYKTQTFEYKLCPDHRSDTGLPEANIGEAEDNTIQLCAQSDDKNLTWTQVSCNTIGAYFKGESPSQLRIEYKLFDRCHYQRIKTYQPVYQERPCTQITLRLKIKTYKLAAVRIIYETIAKVTPTTPLLKVSKVKEAWHVFPGRLVSYSDFQAIDERSLLFDRLLGKKIQLFDNQGRPLITTSNIGGLIEGSQGKADIFGNWVMNLVFPLTRTTINWRNYSQGNQFKAPEGVEIYYHNLNNQPTITYREQDIIPTISGGLNEINPNDAWEDISTEDFKVVDVDGHIKDVTLGNWVDVPGSFDQQRRKIEFKKENNRVIYSDFLYRGSLDRLRYSVDEYEYNNSYCSIFKEEEEDFMADAEEIKNLILESHQKIEQICDRVEAIEGILESVSFPAALWQVPSTGLGDPELGTVNSYNPSPQGLQSTINQLALVLQGLGRTTAHNKTVVSDVGMAIGATEWRKKYLTPEPAKVPESFVKKDGEEAKEIKVNNLTELWEWYFKQFDALIGEFSIRMDVEQPNDDDDDSGATEPQRLEFLNIAEVLAEMLGANLNASVNSDLIVSLLSRSLIESGQVKKLAISNSYYLQAIADYLGFEQKHFKKEIPFSFTPKAESLAQLVKEKKIPVELIRFSGKDNLQVVLLNLLQGAAVSRSGSWRSLRNIADAASVALQIKDIIKSHQTNSDAIAGDSSIEDFKDFARDVESGFIDDTGITKSVYGDRDDSPKIRVIPPKKKDEEDQ